MQSPVSTLYVEAVQSPLTVLQVESIFVDCLCMPVFMSGSVLIIPDPGSRGDAWCSPWVEPCTHNSDLSESSQCFGTCAYNRPNLSEAHASLKVRSAQSIMLEAQ